MRRCLAFCLLAASAAPALACYTVHDRSDRILYRGLNSPVDLRQPLHETVPQRFPGGHLVFTPDSDCATLESAGPPRSSMASRVPLLGNQGPARTPGGGDSIRPGVNVVPSPFAPDEDTRSMGGPPARPRTAAEILRMPLPDSVQTLEPGVR